MLHGGDVIEARHWLQGIYRGTVAYCGTVESIAPHLGVLWLRQGPLRERKLVDTIEYELWKLPS